LSGLLWWSETNGKKHDKHEGCGYALARTMRHIFKARLLAYCNALFLVTGAFGAVDTHTPKQAPINSRFPGTPYGRVLHSHQHESGYHWPDKTNGLFLSLSWFPTDYIPGDDIVITYDVLANGHASGRTEIDIDNGRFGSVRGSGHPDITNFAELAEAVAHLPPPPTNQPPEERWLLVSGIRSNQWFTFIYDRADVPVEVDELFQIAGAGVRWILPQVNSSTNLEALPGGIKRWNTFRLGLRNQQTITFPMNGINLDFTISDDGKTLEETNLATGEKVDSLDIDPSGVEVITASHDGYFLAVTSQNGDGTIRVWDLQRKGPPKILNDFKWLLCLEFSPDGQYLAASGADYRNAFGVWDWRAGKKILIRDLFFYGQPCADSLAWSPDGKIFVAKDQIDDPIILDAKTWKPLATWRAIGGAGRDSQRSVTFSADGMLIGRPMKYFFNGIKMPIGLPADGPLQILDVPTLQRIEAKDFP
jgi:hypothetical protein